MALRIATPHFRVAEFEGGQCFIVVEPHSGDNLNMFRGHVNLRLAEGVSIEHAREISNYLNENIEGIAEQDA
nr:MAG TPA: hypothetical protein [Caudoviricetes sp.]